MSPRLLPLGAIFLLVACSSQSHAPSAGPVERIDKSTCGPALSRPKILNIVRAAFKTAGADPADVDTLYEISIHEVGCDYSVIGTRVPNTQPVHFELRINRSGQVTSWPWCCVPGLMVPPGLPPTGSGGSLRDSDSGSIPRSRNRNP